MGDDVVGLMQNIGRPLDDWQALAVRLVMGQTDEEIWNSVKSRFELAWAANKCGCWVPRQNGKGDILMACELGWLFVTKEPLVIHSAHEYKTAQEGYLRIKAVVEETYWLHRRIKRYWQANGEQGLELTKVKKDGTEGSRLRFMARTKKAGRGFSSGKVILDEAQELTIDQVKSILFVVSAQPNWQILFAGTPPESPTAWAYDLRQEGIDGAEDVLWMDWGIDTLDFGKQADVRMLANPDTWAGSNPGMPHRIRPRTVAGEFRLLKATPAFAMERCGMWLPRAADTTSHPINEGAWEDAGKHGVAQPQRVALAFHVNQSRSHSTIGWAGRDYGGAWRVGLIKHAPGTGWLAAELVDLIARVRPVALTCDVKSEATLRDLAAKGIKPPAPGDDPKPGDLILPAVGDVAAAFGMLVDAVNNRQLAHHDEVPLNVAVTAPPRALGGGSTWDHKAGVEVGPAKCVDLAMWAYDQRDRVADAAPYDPLANIW